MAAFLAVFSLLATFCNAARAQALAVGSPDAGNGWDTRSAVSVRSSSSHGLSVENNLVDGSGVDSTGMSHGHIGLFVSEDIVKSKMNPRGGTVEGSHWVEFQFDKAYRLGEMWIWNYNERAVQYDWRKLGFKRVTIQYSTTGGEKPEEWQTIFDGEIPMAESPAPDFLTPVSLVVNFNGAEAKFVVITAVDSPDKNWCLTADPSGDELESAGLSEVRFFAAGEEKPSSP